jgi:predicted amidophosphoribosyltransferase
MEKLSKIYEMADQIFFPPFCLNCKKSTPENPASLRWLCLECHRQMSPEWQKCSMKPEIEESFYVFDYKKDVIAKKAILALKYNWVRDLAETLNVYIEKERDNIKKMEFDLIIPMPLHKYRLRERGFNQSSLIAQKISSQGMKKFMNRQGNNNRYEPSNKN